ncbi:glycerophosphodiester phosphodiesterase family protein [Bacteriovoracaceae bacterium]|nr:glycerophosphodiester phosphodiesterase family protein [Bacteriovoracaceae bacterium]
MIFEEDWYCHIPIAHRGLYNDEIAENSLKAFENAANHNFPMELDVMLTSDGEVVVFHDINSVRLTGASFQIDEITFEQLSKLKLPDGQSIPKLVDVLDLIRGRVPLIIEPKVKNYNGQLEKKLFDILKDYNGQFAIQAFHPQTLFWFKRKMPDIPRGLLSGTFDGFAMPLWQKIVLRNLMLIPLLKPNYIGLEYKCLQELSPKILRKIGTVPIVAWTIDSFDKYKSVSNHCSNIIFENFIPSKV